MKTSNKLIAAMSAVTGVLVIVTLVLMFTIGPWKKAEKKSEDMRSPRKTQETEVEDTDVSGEEPKEQSRGSALISGSEWVSPDKDPSEDPTDETPDMTSEDPTSETTEPTTDETTEESTEATTEETTEATNEETTAEPTPVPETSKETEETKAPSNSGGSYDLSGMVIVIDPGHQSHANSNEEQVAPWTDETKPCVSAGTTGVATGRPEYEVVLEIGLRMRDVLESMGATVIMTRTTNDVNITNIERAEVAVSNNADVFLRLHCDASDSSSARGIGVFVCSRGSLSDYVVTWGDWLGSCLSESTGSKYRGCDASTRYSGLNWACEVPSFLLEMGFMSNADDDYLLSDPDYQQKICNGVAAFCAKMKNR